jgi:hypothetical protein
MTVVSNSGPIRRGALSRIAAVVDRMKRSGFWVAPKLEREILESAGEDASG